MNRRQFAKNTIMASAVISASSIPGFSNIIAPANRSLKKGIMWGSQHTLHTFANHRQTHKQKTGRLCGSDQRIQDTKGCLALFSE
ncbi:hypothetical protein ES705_48743 [subsurface metagenome]